MATKGRTPEEAIAKFGEAEDLMSQGRTGGGTSRGIGVTSNSSRCHG